MDLGSALVEIAAPPSSPCSNTTDDSMVMRRPITTSVVRLYRQGSETDGRCCCFEYDGRELQQSVHAAAGGSPGRGKPDRGPAGRARQDLLVPRRRSSVHPGGIDQRFEARSRDPE